MNRNKTTKQLFEDYLEDEYQTAVKDSDEYFKAKKKAEEKAEKEKEDKVNKIFWDIIVGWIYAVIGLNTYWILKAIIQTILEGG